MLKPACFRSREKLSLAELVFSQKDRPTKKAERMKL